MRLSALDFMRPDRVNHNLRAVERYADAASGRVVDLINHLQKSPYEIFLDGSRHQLVNQAHYPDIDFTLYQLMGSEKPKEFRLIDPDKFSEMKTLAQRAEDLWSQKYPADYAAYDRLIGRVVYAYRDSYSGGSVSSRIGWIWLSPQPDWALSDYEENLIHEYVHNVLFLEEMVGTLFSMPADVMALPENRIISAIRRVPRYFDQAYHAAAVAIVLAEAELHSGRSSHAQVLVEGVLLSLNELRLRGDLMTENGLQVLSDMVRVSLNLANKFNDLARLAA